MLNGERGAMARAALIMGACTVALVAATADALAAKQRRVEDFLEDDHDYSSFERRRQENLDRLNAGDRSYFAAFDGRVTSIDNPGAVASEYIDDPEAADKLRTIIEDLFPDAFENRPPYEIAFLDSDAFSPFTTSAGGIVITRGFLKQTISQDVLGFVIGHEMSHLMRDDFKAQERKEAINVAAGITILAAGIASGGELSGDSLKAVRAAQALIVLNELALGPAWSRKQESRADELGFDLAMDVGMSPDGAFGLMEDRVEQYRKEQAILDDFCGKKQGIGSLVIKGFVEQAIGAPGLLSDGPNPGHPICQERNAVLSRILASHPNPEKRLKRLTEYNQEFYADLEGLRSQTLYETNALTALSPNGPLARLGYARDAQAALNAGDLTAAETLARKSLSGPDDATPNARYVNFLVQKRKGNRKEAIAHLEKVVKDENTTATVKIYIALADEYAVGGQIDKALALIEHGAGFHGRAPFLPQRVRFLTALGDGEAASAALSECLELRDPLTEARCRTAIIPPESATGETAVGQTSKAPTDGATIFASLLQEPGAASFRRRLESAQSATLLVPSDRAFKRLDDGGMAILRFPENARLLDAFLSAHLLDGDLPATGIGGAAVVSATHDALGRDLLIEVLPQSARPVINGATVIVSDIAAENGRIHVIDHILASPETGAPVAGSGDAGPGEKD